MDDLKKLLTVVLILVLALAVLVPANAASKNANPNAAYGQANSIANKANNTVKQMVKAAQKSKEDDALKTETEANAIMAQAKAEIEALGIIVKCEWTKYEVDGHIIVVDPLYVVDPLPTGKDKKKGN